MNEHKNLTLKAFLKVIIVIACISIIGIVGLYALLTWSIGGTHYTDFNNERITKVESLFGIKVTDDVILENYSENDGWDGDCMLKLKVDDYRDFMKSNICGTIKNYEEYDGDGSLVAYFQYRKDNNGTVSARVYQFSDNSDYNINLWTS